MAKFWEHWGKSTIVSGIIALLLVVTACYAVVTETPVPDYFSYTLGLVTGFFFSEKVTKRIQAVQEVK
ncbi:unnamed protein product [marine sediment metagenome]|uniref:Uncharacterized protein n=1 Tax=marine sediment metagenome TaxID=412755 RepID=X1G153_9ZZZZ